MHEKDVARALAAVGVRFSKAELRALVSMLDKDKNGCVEIAEFMDVLNIEGASGEQAGSADPDAMAAVRASLKKSGANVYEAFDRFDRFGTGRVSRRSFRAACGRKHLRLGLSERALRSLMERFADSDGAVDYASFSKQAESDIGSRRVPRIIEDVSNALRGSGERQGLAFDRADVGGTGKVSRRDFRRTLEGVGVTLGDRDVRSLMDAFDKDRDGKIAIGDFAATVGISMSSGKAHHSPQLGPSISAVHHHATRDVTARDASGELALAGNMWHPKTVSSWLETSATPAERRDFDDLYNSISKYRGVGSAPKAEQYLPGTSTKSRQHSGKTTDALSKA